MCERDVVIISLSAAGFFGSKPNAPAWCNASQEVSVQVKHHIAGVQVTHQNVNKPNTTMNFLNNYV